jgi:hypothetical protein
MAPIIPTILANKHRPLSPAVRALGAVPVSALLVLVLMMGCAVALSPVASGYLSPPAQNESGPEDDEQAPVTSSSVAIPRSRKPEVGSPRSAVSAPSARLGAGAVSHSPLLVPATRVSAWAKLDGAGISMRC